jgi:RHS repeat-associated protein
VSPSANGFLTVYSGTTVPSSVTVLYDSAAASALTIVPVGSDGKIKVYTSQATTPAIDVVGYHTSVESGEGNVAHTLTPFFAADTVNHTGVCNGGTCNRLVANTPTTIKLAGVGTVPANATAVAVVVQAYFPDAIGYLSTWATGGTMPSTATMTFDGDGFISATAILPIGTGGTVTFQSSTGVDVIVQPIGYFDPATRTYTYAYSGDGLRKQKTAPDGTTTKFVWDRSSAVPELLAEVVDEPGTPNDRTIRYLYGPDGTVTADITTMTTGGAETLRWFHHDQLGSTVAITSSTGGLLSTFSYTPEGAVASATGSATTPIGWAGEYRDPETGLTYLQARYYDPVTAQFLTRDPLEALTRSAYGYAGNNPLNLTDPTGLWPGEGLAKSIGDFFTGGDCGDGLLGGIGDALHGLGDVDWSNVAHAIGTGLSYASFIPGPYGSAFAGLSAGFYAASGDWQNAAIMATIAVLGVGGNLLGSGIKEGAGVTIKGIAPEITQLTRLQVGVGQAVVQAPRYGVSVASTDWSWLQ